MFYLYSLFGAHLSELAESSQELQNTTTFAADRKKGRRQLWRQWRSLSTDIVLLMRFYVGTAAMAVAHSYIVLFIQFNP